MVSASSPTAAASVDRPTGPPRNFSTSEVKMERSTLSSPRSSTSNSASASAAQVQSDASRAGSLADHDVELEVLQCRVQHLFHRPGHAVDLVHEQDVALLEVGQDGGQVPGALECRPRRGPKPRADLVGNDPGQRRLAEPGRSREQHVVDPLASTAGAPDQQAPLLPDAGLADALLD